MRVLAICPHFVPDTAPTGTVMTRLADELRELGVDMEVVTSLPWYQDHRVEPGWGGRLVRREHQPGRNITRLHPFPTDKSNILARAAAFGAFTAEAMAWSVATGRRPDVVFAMSPPLTLGTAGWLAARRWRAPLVFNIQDVFPDVAVATRAITNERVINAARALERFTYRRSAAVTVLSEDLAANVRGKLGRSVTDAGTGPTVRVIPNFVDVAAMRPSSRANSYRDDFDLGDRTVVMYAGNVGWSQPLDLVIDAAERRRDRDDVVFVVNGGGAALADLRARAGRLDNVRFVDFQPAERLPDVLAAADVHLVLLRRGLARASVPSKLYSILAAGRPVLAAVDPGTEVERTIADAGAGRAVAPDDGAAFERALDELVDDADRRETMGAAGRRFVEQWHSPGAVAHEYFDLFTELLAARR